MQNRRYCRLFPEIFSYCIFLLLSCQCFHLYMSDIFIEIICPPWEASFLLHFSHFPEIMTLESFFPLRSWKIQLQQKVKRAQVSRDLPTGGLWSHWAPFPMVGTSSEFPFKHSKVLWHKQVTKQKYMTLILES